MELIDERIRRVMQYKPGYTGGTARNAMKRAGIELFRQMWNQFKGRSVGSAQQRYRERGLETGWRIAKRKFRSSELCLCGMNE